MSNKKTICVYGTLKKGGALNRGLDKAKFIKEDKLEGFEMYNVGWFPAIIKSEDPKSSVVVEVYEIDDKIEKELDAIEGYPHLYQKEHTAKGIVYFMEDTERVKNLYPRVVSNNWDVTNKSN